MKGHRTQSLDFRLGVVDSARLAILGACAARADTA